MQLLAHKIKCAFKSNPQIKGTHIIMGLGNPGKLYAHSRHNAGQIFVKHLATQFGVKMSDHKLGSVGVLQHIILFNPLEFMNLSGHPLKKLAEKHNVPITNIVVAHDDLERMPGQCRIKVGGSAAGHNGLKSIIQLMGDSFTRLQIGIGRPQSKDPEVVSKYVLGQLESELHDQAVQKGIVLVRQLLKF